MLIGGIGQSEHILYNYFFYKNNNNKLIRFRLLINKGRQECRDTIQGHVKQ